jgi:hypothetical protein
MTVEEIAARWAASAERLALLFAGEPDEKVEAALAEFRERVVLGWAAIFDNTPAAKLAEIADSIVDQIRTRRREIEAAGAFAPARQSAAAAP